MDAVFRLRGFLPATDPLKTFPPESPLSVLDEIGHDLPSLLEDGNFRSFVRGLRLPEWPGSRPDESTLPALRLYYVRVGFLASAYINQVSQPRATELPASLAVPLCRVCTLLGRPPILSYDGYALNNWKRFDASGAIALGNIDTIQNFVRLYDEHWFILVHVEIEAIAASILAAIEDARQALERRRCEQVNDALRRIADALSQQIAVLRRLPEKMDPLVSPHVPPVYPLL